MGNDLVLEEPPPRERKAPANVKHSDVAEFLDANPGQWVKVKVCETVTQAGSLASNIRHGRLRAFQPAGKYEVVTRKEAVYARLAESADVQS